VTFLFTDVEGSTRLWQEHPEAMTTALARHDEILRGAIGAHDGYVFSTAGDAFAVAFGRSASAVDAAMDAQRALQTERWPGGIEVRVRMGIHTGEAVERDGDYFGPSLNRGARVMAAAHGAQVLVTSTTARLLDGAGVGLVDLGEHRLRDIDGSEHLFQLAGDGLTSEFAPVRSLTNIKSTLPSQRSSFLGRDDEIDRARALLHASRLVTLTGAGGCGKTRLAIEVAAREGVAFTDGTYFVDLARVGDDDAVAETFANAIDFVPDAGAAIDKQVRDRIGTKSVLLVVDNCEHVLDEVADQIDSLLGACPNTRVLATSREALDVDGEQTLRVPSLDIDSENGRPAAVVLFLERAAEIGAELDPADDRVIGEICRRLDGLPLAIELAAARTGVLSPGQILERLDDRFTLLTGGRRRTRGRQQTLEATIDWSYDLLDAGEQDALRRISVMPAAFDLELAAAVLDRTTSATLDTLETLTARSLLHTQRDDNSTQLRYRLLETIRVYAYQRLVDAGDAEATRDRHAHHLADRLDAIGHMPSAMLPAHYPLADDAIAAVEWTHARNDTTLGARLVCGANPIFIGRGLLQKGEDFQDWAALVDDPTLRSKVFICHAVLTLAATSQETFFRFAGLSLEAAGDLPVPWRSRAHLMRMTLLLLVDADAAAEEIRLGQAARRHPDTIPGDAAAFDITIADFHLWHGNYLAAIEVSDRSRWDAELDPLLSMNAHGAFLLASMLADDREAVEAHLRDPATLALRAAWLESARRGEHWLMSYEAIRGAALGYIGEHDQARRDLGDAIALLNTDRMVGVDADFLGAFAWICIACGETERAAVLLDDTWAIARSPNTFTLLIAAQEQLHDVIPGDPAASRTAELLRRVQIRDVIHREHRTRRMLDNELERLGLTP
jgi:predicted ATPase/class 3 adenylate cyclase